LCRPGDRFVSDFLRDRGQGTGNHIDNDDYPRDNASYSSCGDNHDDDAEQQLLGNLSRFDKKGHVFTCPFLFRSLPPD
jgi:hypothetical protein